MKLQNPKKLQKGDTVAVISPAAGLAGLFEHRTANGRAALERMGYKVKFSDHALEIDGYVSASPEKRAGDLMAAFQDPEVNAIVCAIGGNHANQILRYLDFEIIRNNPKIFIGYSDITVLHWAIAKKAGLRTFYGPCLLPEFGEHPETLPYTEEYFKKALTETAPVGMVQPSKTWTDEFLDWAEKKDLTRPRNMHDSEGYEWWRRGAAVGPIFGGAVPSVNHLAGTPYWVDLADKIFFIDIPEGDIPGKSFSMSWLDSFLADLDNIGVFREIKGLVIGRPYAYTDDDRRAFQKIIMNYAGQYDYPILYNANIGHAAPIITLPLGVGIRLDAVNDVFEIQESGVV